MAKKTTTNKNATTGKIKPHVTVKITLKMLKDLDACYLGISYVEDLLPATLSTDPEQNIELALELIARANIGFVGPVYAVPHVAWLAATVDVIDNVMLYGEYHLGDEYCVVQSYDAAFQCQRLAAIADVIASKRGR